MPEQAQRDPRTRRYTMYKQEQSPPPPPHPHPPPTQPQPQPPTHTRFAFTVLTLPRHRSSCQGQSNFFVLFFQQFCILKNVASGKNNLIKTFLFLNFQLPFFFSYSWLPKSHFWKNVHRMNENSHPESARKNSVFNV